MSIDRKQIKQIIIMLNLLNKDKPALAIDKSHIKTYEKGLLFINQTLWKINLICQNSSLTKSDKIQLLQMLPNPNGQSFINRRLAKWLYRHSDNLVVMYQIPRKKLKGGGNKINILEIIVSPLKVVEDKLGPIVTIPLEITTMLVASMSTVCQLISSTVEMLPFPPPFGWVPEIVGDLMLGIHVFSNGFNIFLNISRANWDIAIQSAMGMFPQFLEMSNGLTLQLISVNKFLVMLNQASDILVSGSGEILPMLQPIIQNPISFLNPIRLKKYVCKIMKTLIKHHQLTNQNMANRINQAGPKGPVGPVKSVQTSPGQSSQSSHSSRTE